MRITIEGWDPIGRQPVRGTLTGLDRAQTQAADLVTVELSSPAAVAAEAAEVPSASAASFAATAETAAATAASAAATAKTAAGAGAVGAGVAPALAATAETAAAAAEISARVAAAGAAAAAAVRVAPDTVTIKQNPTALRPGGVGGVRLGACAWDGAFVLAAYLDSQKPGSFARLRAVELGAGMALPGLVLARLGAAVYVTDKPASVVFGRVNAGKNRLLAPAPPAPPVRAQQQQQQQQQQAPEPGTVAVLALDWDDAAGAAAAAASITATGPIDLILGTDCIYPDPDGTVTCASAFLAAVCALAMPGRTKALLSFEARSDELRRSLLEAAAAAPLACSVQRVAPEALPQAYRAPHIELYELLF